MSHSISRAAEFQAGARDMLPVLAAMAPFGLLLGALGVQKGLSGLEVLAMGALVFAGSAQFLAIELWSPDAIALLAGMTFLVNLRHILMGAALAPVLPYRGVQTWLGLHVMADEIWAMTLARHVKRPASWAYYFGLAAPLYFNWLLWTGAGAIFGSAIQDPARYGFDFAFVAIFIVLVRGMTRGQRDIPIYAASAIVSALTYQWLPGPLYVPLGAVAGCAAALALSLR